VRKSFKKRRDPDAFACCQRELEALQKQEDQGRIDLYYLVMYPVAADKYRRLTHQPF